MTDIEVDGFVPGPHSMLAFASVAVTASGEHVGEFEAVLERLPGAQPHPDTWSWWLSQPPEVLAASTVGARPVPEVMADFVTWVQGLGEEREFVASPAAPGDIWGNLRGLLPTCVGVSGTLRRVSGRTRSRFGPPRRR